VENGTVWLPLLFLLAFVGMWLLVTGLLAVVSGWPALARRFPGGSRPVGEVLRRQVVGIGFAGEKGVTNLIVSSSGLYLWATPLFRVWRSPILVPWSEVTYVSEHKPFWGHIHLLRLGGSTHLRIRDGAYQSLRPHLSAGQGEGHR
jgi:hypothetical protein